MVHHVLDRFARTLVLLSIAGCGNNVSLGGTTDAAACVTPAGLTTLAAGQNTLGNMAVDQTSVYWTNESALVKVPVDGGTVTTLASGIVVGSPIAVDATSIYWPLGGGVMKTGKSGGAPITLATVTGPDGLVLGGLAIDSTSVYSGAGYQPPPMGHPGNPNAFLVKVDKMGGSLVTLASEPAGIRNLAVDSSNVYYTTSGSVVSVPLGGGTPQTLVSLQQGTPVSIAVQGSYVYYGTDSRGSSPAGTLMRVPVGGGTPTTLASESDRIYALAVDSANVYWGWLDIGLKSMPLAGGTPTEVACQFPSAIAVSSTSLYWINADVTYVTDSVMRLTPK